VPMAIISPMSIAPPTIAQGNHFFIVILQLSMY
jgi:hypothetical protein